jgi:hypothetical protein
VTESEWLASTDPQKMLEYLRGKVSDRKLRLLTCACCRKTWRLLTDPRSQQAVEIGERLADGAATSEELATARAAAEAAQAEATAAADGAMRAMSHGDFNYYADMRATGHAAGGAAACASTPAPEAASSAVQDFILAASSQCLSSLEAAWWGWDSPSASAEQAAVEADARRGLCALVFDIFGNHFRPPPSLPAAILAWNDGTVIRLAEAAYDDRRLPDGTLDTSRLAILADALLDAGCDDEELLSHLRSDGPHYLGCWGVDLLLGKS